MPQSTTTNQTTRRTPKLNEYQKGRIIVAYDNGISVANISKVLGVTEGQIRTFKSRFMRDFNLPPREISSKTKMTASLGIIIKRLVREHPMWGAGRIAQATRHELPNAPWHPCETTVRRFLTLNRITKKKHRLKPFISEENRVKRLLFANNWVGPSVDQLGLVIWSDETIVRSNPFTRRHSSWVHANDPRPIQERHHSGKFSVLFWGCISSRGPGPLTVVEDTLNSRKYVSLLRRELVPEVNLLARQGEDVRFMHDNASPHKSRFTDEFLQTLDCDVIEWPPYSPDLNPIENIWAWLKYKLYADYPAAESEEELIRYTFEIWDTLDEEMCRRYCSDYNKRLNAVIEANGLQTKY